MYHTIVRTSSTREWFMSELNQEQEISQKAQKILNNTNFLAARFKAVMNLSESSSSLAKQISLNSHVRSIMVSSAPLALANVPTEEMDRLIDLMHKHSDLSSNLAE